MLILLFFIYFLGGSRGPANLGHFYLHQAKEYIGAEVKDPAREKEAKASAKTARKGILKFIKQTKKSGKSFSKLVKNYNSTPEQFDALIEESLGIGRKLGLEWVIAISLARLSMIALRQSDLQQPLSRGEILLPQNFNGLSMAQNRFQAKLVTAHGFSC